MDSKISIADLIRQLDSELNIFQRRARAMRLLKSRGTLHNFAGQVVGLIVVPAAEPRPDQLR